MVQGQPVKILIVEDDEPKRYTIARILKAEGFEIWEAATGSEALELAAARPDLIILDVALPDCSGFDVCRQIKADPVTAAIPILHLSAVFVGSQDRAHGLDSGADGYLTHKVEPLELLATVRALLRARRAEEEARRAARGWQVTFDAIRDGICLLDRHGTVLRCNASCGPILGTPTADLLGRSLIELLKITPPGDHPSSVLDILGPNSVDLSHGSRWLQLVADPIQNDRGEVDGAVCILSDITERKQLEEELRRRATELADSHRRKDEFLAMLAHELRNPLAPIRHASSLLGAGGLDAASTRETGDVLERQVDHLVRLVDDLLDVSRIVRGRIELRREPVTVESIVGRAVEASRPSIAEQRHELTVSLPDTPIWIDADTVRLTQVVSNLLNNAAKYMEQGGHVRLTVEQQPGGVAIRVADEGFGIAAEILPQVFDLFVQAETSIQRAQGGLGIGLTLVKRLVEMHDGTVTAWSAGVGQGSEFVVRLPVLADGVQRDVPQFVPMAVRRLRVLIVEDNIGAATVLSKVLQKFWGHDVITAHDGPTALDAAEKFHPEMVLCDIGLPGMTGYEVARQLRKGAQMRSALLVALTGYGAREDRRQSAEAGFDEHLVKPAGVESLEVLFRHPKLSERVKEVE